MCNRFFQEHQSAKIAERYGAIDMTSQDMAVVGEKVPTDIYPTYRTAIVFQDPEGRVVRRMYWGFIPPWVKDADIKKFTKPNNARDDSIIRSLHEKKGMFYASMKGAKRCIIDVSGWVEWTGEKGSKVANRITIEGQEHISIAGLYTYREKFPGLSCTMITTEAEGLAKTLHDRIPVVLQSREEEDEWLNPASDPFELTSLFRCVPEEMLVIEQREEDQRFWEKRGESDDGLEL